jgi:5-methylcytosine-specific restriction enzyme A
MPGGVNDSPAAFPGARKGYPNGYHPNILTIAKLVVPISAYFPLVWSRAPVPKIRTLTPLVRTLDTRTIRPPQKVKEAIYDTPQFRAWRAQVVARAGGRCEAEDNGRRCNKAQPAHRMYSDHIVELRDGGHPFDLNNGQCLCAVHHEKKTFVARQRRTELWSGSLIQPYLPRPTCRVMLICGPPASGKSTYVRDNAKPDDIVIDLDAIARDYGLGRNRPENVTSTLLRERNRRLTTLAKEPPTRIAWVIVGAPGQKLRRWWCEALGVQQGDMVLLLPPMTELQRRVMNDPDRKRICDLQLQGIDGWMTREHERISPW